MSTKDGVSRVDALIRAVYRTAVDPAAALVLRERILEAAQQAPPHARAQERFLESVLAHIQRALALADTSERVRAQRRHLARLVDAIAPAICIVDGDGALVARNRTARDTFPDLDGASPVVWLGLGAESPASFQAALAAAEEDGYSCMLLRCKQSGDALRVHIGRLSSTRDAFLAMVVFPESGLLRAAAWDFAERYRLTPKERDVMEEALRSPRLKDAARAQAIGYHTARQHLRSIYEKTGARSQAELLACVTRHVVVRDAVGAEDASLLPHTQPAASHTLQVGHPHRRRNLCYSDYGAPDGLPVLYFHTVAGSRFELALHDERLKRNRIRLIAFDRPGFGGSDYLDYETYETLTPDVCFLLDHLKLQRVGLLACSAGIPHALSCAVHLPERVFAVQCVGCVPPTDHVFASASPALRQRAQAYLLQLAPGLMLPALELLLRRQTVDSVVRVALGDASRLYRFDDRDVEFFSHPERFDHFVTNTIAALQQGTKACAKEFAMANLPWGIPFGRTRCRVEFWHGDADEIYPMEMIESFAAEFRDHRTTPVMGETHLLVHRQLDRILPVFQGLASKKTA